MSTSRDERPTGLRERKKAKTRAAIQEHALRLFVEQGYNATTVEQIAAAAEVSQSTFFRYFPTKEDTVVYDRLDPVMVEAFLRQPAELSPIAALRATLREVFGALGTEESELERARQRLIFSAPELRGKLIELFEEGSSLLAGAVAKRTGRKADDLAVQAFTGGVIGVLMSAYFASVASPDGFIDAFDRSLGLLEEGLPL
jgi:AcrR family transcriptional regulator